VASDGTGTEMAVGAMVPKWLFVVVIPKAGVLVVPK